MISYTEARTRFERAHGANETYLATHDVPGCEVARFTEAEIRYLRTHILGLRFKALDEHMRPVWSEPEEMKQYTYSGEALLWSNLTNEFPEIAVECTDHKPLGGGLQGYLEGLDNERQGVVVENPRTRAEREGFRDSDLVYESDEAMDARINAHIEKALASLLLTQGVVRHDDAGIAQVEAAVRHAVLTLSPDDQDRLRARQELDMNYLGMEVNIELPWAISEPVHFSVMVDSQ